MVKDTRRERAILLSGGKLGESAAKSTHGLVRGPARWEIAGVVDAVFAGQDAGVVLDGRARGIPVRARVVDFLSDDEPPTVAVVGVATHGGVLPGVLRGELIAAASRGLSLVNGLHHLLADDAEVASAAAASGARIIDVRRPKRFAELRFWSGDILRLATPRVAVLGIDCAIGKRTTTMALRGALHERGVSAEAIYTGQTGWMQGLAHGFVFDATPNDFVSGELEGAILACNADLRPDLILIEGQSGLRNPSGPCGAEFLLSAAAKTVVLQHAPGRVYFDGLEKFAYRLPPVEDECALIGAYGARVAAITLNSEGIDQSARESTRDDVARRTGLPVFWPLEESDALAAVVAEAVAR